MSFLHPEFIFWMSPFVGILFYFWFTQKHQNQYHFSPEALEKLQVDGSELGDNGRNTLFLSASLLIILALAQPVVEQEKIVDAPETIIIALDISNHPSLVFEAMKKNAIDLVAEFEGAVELVAYNSKVYRIAPESTDKKMLKELIENLSPQIMSSSVSDEKILRNVGRTPNIVVVSGSKRLDRREIENLSRVKERWVYTSLFYYPLGLAILCIAMALSSMSKRQSISIAFVAMIFAGENDSRAGVMDFRLLQKANSAYSHGEYEQSARFFNEYRMLHDGPQIRYNYANALFKAGHSQRALYWYKRVNSNDPKLKEWVRINSSQLQVKEGESTQKSPEYEGRSGLDINISKMKKRIEIRKSTPLFLY